MSILKRTILIFMAVILNFSINICVFASSELSLTVECAYGEETFSDVNVKIYLIARETGEAEWEITEEFADYSVSVGYSESPEQMRAAALALATYIERDSIPPYDYGRTDINGKVRFPVNASRLEKGIYLVVTDDYETENNKYVTEPFLVFLTDDNTEGDVIAKPKFFDKETRLLTTVKVLKVWEGSETQRPEEIEVELIRDEKIIDTVILNEKMNWRYTWDNLEKGNYLVCEKNVPQGYEMSITHEGKTFVIKNTANELTTGEDNSQSETTTQTKLPQTGMLKWPVPYLAGAGILFFMAGWVINRKNELKNEK